MDPSSSSKRKRDLSSYDELSNKRPKYDVFVNYASEDIGNGFVSHLKGALGREGFTICDHNELPKGEDKSSELLKAIEDSEIFLVVFSPKYASYKECLDEFVLIMETYPMFKKRKVFPIFFDVEPSHVRNQQGSFLQAFQGYEKSVDAERVQIWRQALKGAGDKSGVNLKDWRDEDQFIRQIVKDVRKMQNPQQLCDLEHLVGIDSRVQDIISALKLGDQAFSIVAVLGISGSGKTTVVKAVYDRIAADFDVGCFIQDIHSYEYRGRNWKDVLQKDVISYLNGNDKLIASHNDEAAKIKKLISGRKVLLVLDDVYTFEHLQALSIHSASFHCGSRIIVTTRNTQSLCNLQHTSYKIKKLNTRESFELFTRLIGKGNPMDKKFVDAIVWCARGIPLVLEVWSRHFTVYDRELWPSMLETLKRIPHEDTQKKLQISYDSLPKKAQNLFLDIACFFQGMSKDLIVKVLQDEHFFSDVEIQIQNLVHKFMVKCNWIDGEIMVLLHEVIKEMGQEVVRRENEDEPGKRTRLTGWGDVAHVLENCSGTDSVKSIQLSYGSGKREPVNAQLEAFKQMSNLRFIKLDNPELQWLYSSNDDMSDFFFFKHLKYLEWHYFPCKSLDNIDMPNVVVIKLPRSKLEKLWKGVKSFKKLKILDVTYSASLNKTGDFSGLVNLEELHLITRMSIPNLPPSIKELHVSGCINLVNLPFNNSSQLQLLTALQLINCVRLGSEGFTQVTGLTNLCTLNMENCNVSEVSYRIGNLVSLVTLRLPGNTFSSLPETFRNLSKVVYLNINDCSQLQLLPPLPSKLRRIDARNCESLDVMPFDSMKNTYIFLSKAFKESLINTKGFSIGLSGEELPEWCSYRHSENVLSFVAPIQFDHSKICGLILCATIDKVKGNWPWVYPTIYNKTKGTSHRLSTINHSASMMVMFYPLDDTMLLVEGGDTVELRFFKDFERVKSCGFKSCGLRWIYEDDVVDSGLVLKDVTC